MTDAEWAKLYRLIDGVTEQQALAPHAGTTIRDIFLHRAHWTGLFFQWLREGDAAEMPDHGVKWNQLKPYNEGLKDRYANTSWEEAREALIHCHKRLSDWIAAQEEATLYGGPMPGGTGWTTGRYAEASGASHYRSAAKVIRKILRATASE